MAHEQASLLVNIIDWVSNAYRFIDFWAELTTWIENSTNMMASGQAQQEELLILSIFV